MAILSPLRYPGAKRRLSAYIAESLRLNHLKPSLFVEPFAGGASVALELLERGLVETVALGEKDPLVADFWRVLFRRPDWLIEQLETIDVSVERWNEIKHAVYKSDLDRARACLYLNRTSFSGILGPTAGPIGGQRQKSAYSIGCRFSIKTLKRRITQIAALADRIAFVNKGDWRATMARAKALGHRTGAVFCYFDPPFFAKADRLYNYYFKQRHHEQLRDFLWTLRSPWLLSYDPAAEIIALYSERRTPRRLRLVELLYSTSASADLLPSREVIVSNLKRLPRRTRLWRSVKEWAEQKGSIR